LPCRQTPPIGAGGIICAHTKPGKTAAKKIALNINLLLILIEDRLNRLRRHRLHRLLHRVYIGE
jgi:hypothetical protein